MSGILYAVFDLELARPGPDFLYFLVQADIAREENGLDSVHVLVVPAGDGAVALACSDEPAFQSCLSAACLLPSLCAQTLCHSRAEAGDILADAANVFPAGYTIQAPVDPGGLEALVSQAAAGRRTDRLRATEQARLYARQWLCTHSGDGRAAAITLGDGLTDITVLSAIADDLAGRGYAPVLVRGAGEPFDGVQPDPRAWPEFAIGSVNLELLAGLFAEVDFNVGGGRLPAALWRCLKEQPYLHVVSADDAPAGTADVAPLLRGCEETIGGDQPPQVLLARMQGLLERLEAGGHARTQDGGGAVDQERLDFAKRCQVDGRYHDAMAIYLTLLERHPDDGECRFLVGTTFFDTGDFTRAVEYLLPLEPSQGLNPRYVDVLARAYLGLGDDAAADKLLQPALREHPQDANLLARLGDVLVARRQADAAADCYRRALSLGASAEELQPKLAATCIAMGAPEEAVQVVARELRRGAVSIDVLEVLAQAMEASGQAEHAVVCRNAKAAVALGRQDALDRVNHLLEAFWECAA